MFNAKPAFCCQAKKELTKLTGKVGSGVDDHHPWGIVEMMNDVDGGCITSQIPEFCDVLCIS